MDRILRIFDILEFLAPHSNGVTVTEVSKRLDLPISSTHNLLQKLVSVEAVVVTDGLRYSLGARAVRYGIAMMEGLELRSVARKTLQELAHQIKQDVYLAERFGSRVTYTDRVLGPKPVAFDIRLGQSLYLHSTSVGKLFAAHHQALRDKLFSRERPKLTEATLVGEDELNAELDRILIQGYASSWGEAIPGIVGISVPIMDARNTMVGAIHISVFDTTLRHGETPPWLEDTRAAARIIEHNLGRDTGGLGIESPHHPAAQS
jgi:DNA-binding IclR family transcriptional regulator